MRCDVAVIGAGPAGLNAAKHIACRGLTVVVLDEYYRAGGRLLGQIYEDRRRPAAQRLWDGAAIAAQLEADVRAAGGVILVGRTVWYVESGWRLHIAPGPDAEIDARAVIVATGAAEHAIPIPGWTLPGVMTIGAAQVLTNVHAVAPGQRVLVVGMDPLALSIIGEMVAAGVNVVAAVLPPPGPLAREYGAPADVIGQLSQVSALAPNLALRLGGRVFAGRLRGIAARLARFDLLKAWGVPLRLRTALVEIVGKERVESAVLRVVGANGAVTGSSETLLVDAVCISGGLTPLSDLVRVAGCPMVEVPQLGGTVPLHGPALETRVPGLFVAGNVVGIESASVAAAQGRLAAAGALRFLGTMAASEADREIADAKDEVARSRRSAAFRFLPEVEDGHRHVDALWREESLAIVRAHRSFGTLARSELIVCRCEQVSLDQVVAAFDDGATAVAGVKKRTRACMGRCQGRVCEDVLRRLADARGNTDLPRHRSRIPVRPVRITDF